MPESAQCAPFKPNETVYMMCLMLDMRDKSKAEAKAKKKKALAE